MGTQNAVKKWQSRNGLIADGIVGAKTWSKMFSTPVNINEKKSIIEPVAISHSGSLKIQNLKGYIPDNVLAQIPDTAKKFNINTPLRLAHFLAQCAHESGNFRITQENLNYSKDGLNRVFPKYFPNNLAESYAATAYRDWELLKVLREYDL